MGTPRNPTPRKFDWHDYVTVSPDFTTEQRAMIEKSMTDIANAHDGEGRELIMKAARRSGGRLTIAPSANGSDAAGGSPNIDIDFNAIAKTTEAGADGKNKPVLLTEVMVHELYHKGDFKMARMGILFENGLMSAFRARQIDEKDPELKKQFNALLKAYDSDAHPQELMADMELIADPSNTALQAKLRKEGYSKAVDALAAIGPEGLRQSMHAACATDEHGVVRTERDAVAYTDAFMRKNFGDAAPRRGTYGNIHTEKLAHIIPSIDLVTLPQPTAGFQAQDCGPAEHFTFSSPAHVRPVPVKKEPPPYH